MLQAVDTLFALRDEWIRPNANAIFVTAAREAQTRLQNWTYADLVNHSRRLTSSSEGSSLGSGGSRVEDNEGILEHVDRGSPHIEMWRLLVGDFSGSRVFAVWSVTQPGERDFWLYMLDVHPVPGPSDTPPEAGTNLADADAQLALQRLLTALAEHHQPLQGGVAGFGGLQGVAQGLGGQEGHLPMGPGLGMNPEGPADPPLDPMNTPVGPLFQPSSEVGGAGEQQGTTSVPGTIERDPDETSSQQQRASGHRGSGGPSQQ